MDDKNLTINNDNNEILDIEIIYKDIKEKILTARSKMLKHIDTTMTEVYWYVGKITYELSENSTKASYGKKIIDALSVKLTNEFGSGFSPVSIRRMRRFYEFYPIWSTVSTELSWAHFQELIRIDRKEERDFYEKESIKSNWGCRELRRQINTKLYDRYLISPDKQLIIEESKKGLIEKQPEELLKNPYIFEFAGLKEKLALLNDKDKEFIQKVHKLEIPWTEEIGDEIDRLTKEKVEIKPGFPLFGTVILDCDIIVYLDIDEKILSEHCKKRKISLNSALDIKKSIEEDLKLYKKKNENIVYYYLKVSE